jgi:branched-subunit amino acid aminotransferase/4-amino-4-deoxychorismate lyase
MPEPLALLNGEFVPASQATVPVDDAGFMLGVTVPEQLRTFAGKLFRLQEHLARLARGLEIVGVACPYSGAELDAFAQQLVAHNHALLPPGNDLGLTMFVTPGPSMPQAGRGPLVCMHTRVLPLASHLPLYERGQDLVTTSIRQVPPDCWPAELKCRSRMHYWLAEREARNVDPAARALMLDHDDFVMEASTANIVLYRAGEGLVSPPKESILPGISVAMLADLSRAVGLSFVHRPLRILDVLAADEVLLCSTSPCVWPVLRLNGQTIGAGAPGPVYQQLIGAWSQQVGIDIIAQARHAAQGGAA